MTYLQKRLIAFLAVAFLLLVPVGLSLAEKAPTPVPTPKTAEAMDKTSALKLQEVEKKLARIETIIEERGKDARLSVERIMDLEQIKIEQAGLREKVSAHHDFTTQILVIAGIIVAIALGLGGITFKTKVDSTVKEAQEAVNKAEKSLNEIEETLKKAKSLTDHIDNLSKKALQGYTYISNQRAKEKAAQERPSKPREEIEQELKSSKDFEELAKISGVPLPASHYFNLAYNSAALGKKQEAVELYTKAIELKPDYAEAFNNRGNLFVELKKNEKAASDYKKAIELKPDYAKAYNNRGALFAKLGRNDEAMQDVKKAIELEPDFAEAYDNLGILFAKLDKDDEAMRNFNKAIELNPDDAETYANRYRLHKKLGNKDRAASDYNKALGLDPSLKDRLKPPDE